MNFRISFFIFVLFFTNSYCQNYAEVDSIVDRYSKDVKSTDVLATLIKNDFNKEEDKARAIFRWVTSTISFDVETAELMEYESLTAFSYTSEVEKKTKEKKFKSDLITSALLNKIAVCHGYAVLVEDLCYKVGLKSEIITGNLKSNPSHIGLLPTILNHAWNVVMIGNQWKFIDATLGAGVISSNTNKFKADYNEAYFFTDPAQFFLNHYPLDEKWLLIPKNKKTYAELPLFLGNYFKYNFKISKEISGIHSISLNPDFAFTLNGLSEYDDIQYIFINENERHFFTESDNGIGFKVSLKGHQDDFLCICVNGKVIAIYKIVA